MDALFSTHPKSKYWIQEKNGTITPSNIKCNNQSMKYWFHCDICNHDFDSIIHSITKGSWCGFCANRRRCNREDCEFCFNHSFASHDKAKYWSDKNKSKPRDWALCCNDKFWFICEEKHDFEISLDNIIFGKWCRTCGFTSMKQKQSMKLEEFLEKSKKTHGDIYDYSKVIMNGVDRYIIIICNIHGEFSQTPYGHYNGYGCQLCGIKRASDSKRYTNEEFIEKSNMIHNNAYDYSKVIYENQLSKVIIGCRIHGDFISQANHHMWGHGCKLCGIIKSSNAQRITNDEFISRAKEVHGNLFDYLRTNYISAHKDVIITCKIHGDFEQDPFNHLSGYKCRRCYGMITCKEDFIEKANIIHNNIYDYSLVNYKKSVSKVKIICKMCGEFEQSPNSHLNGQGCPTCVNKTEKKLLLWLKKYYDVTPEFKQPWCIRKSTGKELRFDFLLEEFNIIIELDGGQHFKQVRNWLSPEQQIRIDVYKMQQANRNGYTVIRLLQADVFCNDLSWLETNLKSDLHIYDEPINIVIYDEAKHGDIYNRHLILMDESDISLEDIEHIEVIDDSDE